MNFDLFMQYLTNGISLGSLYALIAIGYTMVYGILRLINFAHGEIFMMSLYFAFYGVAVFTMPWYITFLVAIILTAGLGMTVERAAYKPLRHSPGLRSWFRLSALLFSCRTWLSSCLADGRRLSQQFRCSHA
jgi:branched-chain amino acid transport system permease protein